MARVSVRLSSSGVLNATDFSPKAERPAMRLVIEIAYWSYHRLGGKIAPRSAAEMVTLQD